MARTAIFCNPSTFVRDHEQIWINQRSSCCYELRNMTSLSMGYKLLMGVMTEECEVIMFQLKLLSKTLILGDCSVVLAWCFAGKEYFNSKNIS